MREPGLDVAEPAREDELVGGGEMKSSAPPRERGPVLSARSTTRYDSDMNARMFREDEILFRASATRPALVMATGRVTA
jgi:hypothetical protein